MFSLPLDLGREKSTLFIYYLSASSFPLCLPWKRNPRFWKLIGNNGAASHLPQAPQLCHKIQPAQGR